jgi:hypothetical protein
MIMQLAENSHPLNLNLPAEADCDSELRFLAVSDQGRTTAKVIEANAGKEIWANDPRRRNTVESLS